MDINYQIEYFLQNLTQLGNRFKKKHQEKFLENAISFIGVDESQIKELLIKWYHTNQFEKLPLKNQMKIARKLLERKIAEEKISGGLLIQLFILESKNFIPILYLLENLYDKKKIYDWNTSDWLCTRLLTPMIDKRDQVCIQRITSFKDSSYLYQARASAVSFVKVKDKKKYQKEIEDITNTLIKQREQYIINAVSWLLREYSKDNKEFVFKFVESNLHYFNRKTILNTLKYYPKEQAKYFI